MKFEKKFYTRFGPGEVTWVMKVEDWAIRRDDWLGKLVLTFVVPWLKELWVELKTKETMADVDAQAEALVDTWESEEPSMQNHTHTVIEDPESPLGLSEIRASYDFMDKSSEE
jgi:hypothetical protein